MSLMYNPSTGNKIQEHGNAIQNAALLPEDCATCDDEEDALASL